MKTVLMTIVLIVVLTSSGFAQLEKGSMIGGVGGNFSVNSRSPEIRLIGWSFNPYAMYLVRNNFALGLSLDNRFQHGKNENILFRPVLP